MNASRSVCTSIYLYSVQVKIFATITTWSSKVKLEEENKQNSWCLIAFSNGYIGISTLYFLENIKILKPTLGDFLTGGLRHPKWKHLAHSSHLKRTKISFHVNLSYLNKRKLPNLDFTCKERHKKNHSTSINFQIISANTIELKISWKMTWPRYTNCHINRKTSIYLLGHINTFNNCIYCKFQPKN